MAQPPKLLDQVRQLARFKHMSLSTEKSYVYYIKDYIFFHRKRHPKEMGAAEVQAFLTYLAMNQNVAASTQNQALSALLFLYRHVLHQPLDLKVDAVRARIMPHRSKSQDARRLGRDTCRSHGPS